MANERREGAEGGALAPTTPGLPAAPAEGAAAVPATVRTAPAARQLSGIQKAAVLLTALGPERAKSILQNFADDEIERVVKEIARTRSISTEVREVVLGEAYRYIFGEDVSVQGRLMAGRETVRELLNEAVGELRARNIMDRLDIPQTEIFTFVGDNDLEALAHFLENQLPQTTAVTLLHLRPEHMERVVSLFPDKLKAEVVSRMVHLDKVDRTMVQMLRETLQKQLQVSRNLVNVHGQEGATTLLKRIPGASQEAVLRAIAETDPELSEQIEQQLLTFEDMYELDPRDFGRLMQAVYAQDKTLIPKALKSCSQRMKNKVYENVTLTRREEFQYSLEVMGRIPVSQVHAAQRRIIDIAKDLAEDPDENKRITFGGTEELV
jgi:flagellar motor switch protein FliG